MIILKFHLIRKSNRQAGGFTLVEVLITMGIIIVLSALMITNFGQGGRGLAAQKRVASVVAGDLRYAQSLALSGGGYNNQQVCGFGVHFVNSISYLIYARTPEPNCAGQSTSYQQGDPIIDEKSTPSQVRINTNAITDVFFIPPDATVYVNDSDISGLPKAVKDLMIYSEGASDCEVEQCVRVEIYNKFINVEVD